ASRVVDPRIERVAVVEASACKTFLHVEPGWHGRLTEVRAMTRPVGVRCGSAHARAHRVVVNVSEQVAEPIGLDGVRLGAAHEHATNSIARSIQRVGKRRVNASYPIGDRLFPSNAFEMEMVAHDAVTDH